MDNIKILVLLITLVISLLYLFPLAKVVGESMYPTLKNGQVILCSRLFSKSLKVGDIYVFKSPKDDRIAIKRLSRFKHTTNLGNRFCYFLGDNSAESYDSRDYGYIKAENIIAKLMWQRKH